MMSLKNKKAILLAFFRANGGLPKGAVTIDNDTATVGNVFVNGCWIGAFDYEQRCFVIEAD